MPSFSAVRPNYNAKKTALNVIKGVNKKLPQVVVKISGSSKGANKAQAHADYIGRNGKVEIEDQDGNKYKGKNEQKSCWVLGWQWACTTNTKLVQGVKPFILYSPCPMVQTPLR